MSTRRANGPSVYRNAGGHEGAFACGMATERMIHTATAQMTMQRATVLFIEAPMNSDRKATFVK
jgi:hypothetical protein